MSTSVTVDDQSILDGAIKRLRTEGTVENFVLVNHHEGNPNVITLQSEGEGVDNLASQLDETQVQYALVRMQEQFDISTNIKFVYIHWIGEKVPFSKKGRYGVVHGSVRDQFFRPSHSDIETSSIDDISKENINKLITETSGTKSKVLENSEADNRPKRGFTSTPTSQSQLTKSKGPVIPVSSAGAEVKHGEDVTEAIKDVRNDETDTVWACIGYGENNVKKPLTCVASGSGDIDELKNCLEDDKPFYFLYRTTDTIDGHVTVKFVYIIWVGESVKPMSKAKLSTHKGVVQDIFDGCHVTIFATSRSEISQAIVTDKVQTASGTKSHVK